MKTCISILATIILFSTNPSHANFTCNGSVSGVSVDALSGEVAVERIGSLAWPKLCNLSATANGIKPEHCKAIYSTLMAAQMASKQVVLYFTGDKGCSSLAQWVYAPGFYFITVN